ncbi:peptidylprolyl isomerase [Candidatus Bathyarchaeota archaeon]|nr:MAG: peptidylprolyl isomerase [Candidatus Bathyarchaeota archaeon]
MSEKEEEKVPVEEKPEEPEETPRKTKAKRSRKKAAAKPEGEKAVAKGDFILVEMTGRAEETGEVFDTTDEETARSAGIYSDDRVYGPKLVVVGEGWILKGLDERLEGLKVGETVEVEIPPEEAFGERNPDNIRMVPYRILRSKGINPAIGAQIEVDGRSAIVRSIGAGRVQLDYNHPLAGRKIIYEVKVTKRYEGDEEKIRALIGRRFLGIDTDKFGVKLMKKKVRIQVPDEIFFAENIQIAKRGVALDIQRFFPDIKTVEYVEVIEKKT